MVNGKINIQWVVNDIKNTSVYYPILEWIVNWIQAIHQTWRQDWKIQVHVIRSNQLSTPNQDAQEIPNIEWFEITDNGTWFNEENQESFETFRSDYKLLGYWWKWFWRFFYLKFFEKVVYDSHYQKDWKLLNIKFKFDISAEDMMSEKSISEESEIKETWTKLILKSLKKAYLIKLNNQSKTLETLWRKLLEHLLIYFVDEAINCPEITLTDTLGNKLLLNSLIWAGKDIETFYSSTASIKKKIGEDEIEENFWIKIFKIRYWTDWNNINLCWHNRVVTEESLWKYIPDFRQQLKEKDENGKDNNFSIKCYIFWDYLDSWVDTERSGFNFIKDEDLFQEVILEEDIVSWILFELKKIYEEFLKKQEEIKNLKIKDFINNKAPWYWILYKEFDLSSIDSSISEEALDLKFHELKYKKEREAKIKVDNFVKSSDFSNQEEVLSLVNSLSDVVKTDLAHYVATRKFTLDLLFESLKWNEETQKYKSEDSVHTIIFPTKTDSEEISYDDHNMWILDEKLAFANYIASDKPLNWWTTERPDIIIYDNPIALRWDNTPSNPVTIFEFKKPSRVDFTLSSTKKDEDPIEQIKRYRNNIMAWKFKTPEWIEIEVQDNTPFYGYVVCTFNKAVKDWLRDEKNFTMMPDWRGYFTWLQNLNMYVEVLDWSKVINDSRIRNQKFFEKLKIN